MMMDEIIPAIYAMKINRFFEKTDKEFMTMFNVQHTKETQLIPDANSSPLKLTKEQVGRYAWGILHSMAATFPNEPTIEDKKNFAVFLQSFSKLYPCKECAKHFQQLLKEKPIKDANRKELVFYVCDLHNVVNVQLKKPKFDCEKAFDVWGGNCGCGGK